MPKQKSVDEILDEFMFWYAREHRKPQPVGRWWQYKLDQAKTALYQALQERRKERKIYNPKSGWCIETARKAGFNDCHDEETKAQKEFFGQEENMKKYYYLTDSDGGEHEFYGTLEDAKAEALERGYHLDENRQEGE